MVQDPRARGNHYTQVIGSVQGIGNTRFYRDGTIVICRKASMRWSSGGCVLKSEERPFRNMGLTMQSAAAAGASVVLGMRWL